jgi:hypothetical protein
MRAHASNEERIMHTTTLSLRAVITVLTEILEGLGEDRVAGLTLMRGSLRIEPSALADGAVIARELGLVSRLDHCMAIPAITDWSGTVGGLECHVRALAGAVQ